MSETFIPNRNFLREIDHQLNVMEFYLRAKWGKYNGKNCYILKSKPNERGHLRVFELHGGSQENVLAITCTITGVYYPKATSDSNRSLIPYLRIPRGHGQYQKTWGDTDYIMGFDYNAECNQTMVYYFSQEKLFEFLNVRRKSEVEYLKSLGIDEEAQYKLADDDCGIAIEKLSLMGIIEHQDIIYWDDRKFQELRTNNWNMESCYFRNTWNNATEMDKKVLFEDFELRVGKPQEPTKVRLWMLANPEKVKIYDSIYLAADAFFGFTNAPKEIRSSKEYKAVYQYIGNCVRGTSKSFAYKGKRFSAAKEVA